MHDFNFNRNAWVHDYIHLNFNHELMHFFVSCQQLNALLCFGLHHLNLGEMVAVVFQVVTTDWCPRPASTHRTASSWLQKELARFLIEVDSRRWRVEEIGKDFEATETAQPQVVQFYQSCPQPCLHRLHPRPQLPLIDPLAFIIIPHLPLVCHGSEKERPI